MVKVIDSIMGSGKTDWAIKYMNDNAERRFIYITPFNDEISGRVIPACPALGFEFAEEGRKVAGFARQLSEGKNIVATHECLKRIDTEVIKVIEEYGYTLILDEALQVIKEIRLKQADVEFLKTNFIDVDERGRVAWKAEHDNYDGVFKGLKNMTETGELTLMKNMFFWKMSDRLFRAFKDVYILTYIFPGQLQKYYFDISEIEYQVYELDKGNLIPHSGEYRNDLKPLIDIYEGSINEVGKNKKALSRGWFATNREGKTKLKKNIYNYFFNIANVGSKGCLWTTFKTQQKNLQGNGYIRAFLPCNARGTNKYRHTTAVAYAANRYMNPQIKNYLKEIYELEFNEDLWALSEMLQFIWRSAIRDRKPIQVYVPSKRMRELLHDYLDNKI